MISEPDRYLGDFAEAGADTMIVHQEGAIHLNRTVQAIHAAGQAGRRGDQPGDARLGMLEEILPELELVLVMTVNPGFGGQKFLAEHAPQDPPRAPDDRSVPETSELEVDGGIEPHTAPWLSRPGRGCWSPVRRCLGPKAVRRPGWRASRLRWRFGCERSAAATPCGF